VNRVVRARETFAMLSCTRQFVMMEVFAEFRLAAAFGGG